MLLLLLLLLLSQTAGRGAMEGLLLLTDVAAASRVGRLKPWRRGVRGRGRARLLWGLSQEPVAPQMLRLAGSPPIHT